MKHVEGKPSSDRTIIPEETGKTMTTETIQKTLETIFFAFLLILSMREFVFAILILKAKKPYKLLGYYLSWPVQFVEKMVTGKRNEKYDQNYYRQIRLYAWSSFLGAPLIILVCVLQLMKTWG